jgi:hypothetical protein
MRQPYPPAGRRRLRGLAGTDIAGIVLGLAGAALVAGLLLWEPDSEGTTLSQAVSLIAQSGTLYKEAEGNARLLLDTMNSSGEAAQAMEQAGGLPDTEGAQAVGRLFRLEGSAP